MSVLAILVTLVAPNNGRRRGGLYSLLAGSEVNGEQRPFININIYMYTCVHGIALAYIGQRPVRGRRGSRLSSVPLLPN